MAKIIIYDFEVFRYDTLLGAKILENNNVTIMQTWSLQEMISFYNDNTESIWIGHNNSTYDNIILQGVVQGMSSTELKSLSDSIIAGNRHRLNMHLYFFDMITVNFNCLKSFECAAGKEISTSQVDFNLDRPLTDDEKQLTLSYNYDDLEQTFDNFVDKYQKFTLRLDMINEFKLPMAALNMTGTQVAETVLHAEKVWGIEKQKIKPILYPQLQIQNQDVIDFYLSEGFRNGKKLKTTICGVEHSLGSGGIHAAKKKYHADEAYYFDVSGYYNLIMINYDLLPRSIPEEYVAFYEYMYREQLKLKSKPELAGKRSAYKTTLLSVFGAMMNKYCKFYDPERGSLVTITGQLFLVDLLEKLEGKVELVQSNTDGIVVIPTNGTTEETLNEIVDEWQNRTGFVLHFDKIRSIHQRDVNTYMYMTSDDELVFHGDVLKYYGYWEVPMDGIVDAKEPAIFSYALANYFFYGITPEETIDKYKRELRMFQYICKKRSYSWLEFVSFNEKTNTEHIETSGYVFRAFANNDETTKGMVYKRKTKGKTLKAKIQNLPDNVFVYDDEILSENAVDILVNRIDYDYYVLRAYEKISEYYDE